MVLSYAIAAAFLIAQFSRSILPARNFNDDSTIQDFIAFREVSAVPSAYSTTAWLFRTLGLGDSPSLVGFVAVLLTAISVIVAIKKLPVDRRSWLVFGAASLCLVFSGLYLGKYSKEFFIVPIVLLGLILSRKWLGEVVWLAIAFMYAAYVRDYWAIIVVLYIAFRIVLRTVRRFSAAVIAWLAVPVVLVVVFNVLLGVSANYYRSSTNDGLQTDRATIILDPIVSSFPLLQMLNLVIVLGTLLIPIPLVFAGSAIHVFSAVFLGAVWVSIIVSFKRRVIGFVDISVVQLSLLDRCTAFLLAYVSVQALFEPDYGSYLRHLVPVLPFAVFALGYTLLPKSMPGRAPLLH